MADIKITGWGKTGPSYEVSDRKLDRNQMGWVSGVVEVKKNSGKPDSGASHKYITHGDNKWVAFKKGYNYTLLIKANGVVSEIVVDAQKSHRVLSVDPSVSLKVESE